MKLRSSGVVLAAMLATFAPGVPAAVGARRQAPASPAADGRAEREEFLLRAVIVTEPQYGRATIVWTPTAAQAGVHDISLEVSDSGLPPQDAGYIPDPDVVPVPSVTVRDLRIVVRAANLAPELIALQATGAEINGDALAGSITTVMADEGAPLALEFSAREPDLDAVNWTVEGMPAGMWLEPVAGTDGQSRLVLRWTPGLFAAQSDNANGATPGHYRLVVKAGDGQASATREIDLVVRNVNQAPRLLPMPLQLVSEGETIAFTLLAADADNDAVRLSMLHDAGTPAGVHFDPNSGTFEWTPDAEVVNNAQENNRAFTFNFSATDGTATTLRSVQVRVFDVRNSSGVMPSDHRPLMATFEVK